MGLADEEIVWRAWDLDHVAARYEQLIERFDGLAPEPGDDVLCTHVALVIEWRQVAAKDPQLPDDLLPGWIGRRATEMFVSRRAMWKDAARARWREILTQHAR